MGPDWPEKDDCPIIGKGSKWSRERPISSGNHKPGHPGWARGVLLIGAPFLVFPALGFTPSVDAPLVRSDFPDPGKAAFVQAAVFDTAFLATAAFAFCESFLTLYFFFHDIGSSAQESARACAY